MHFNPYVVIALLVSMFMEARKRLLICDSDCVRRLGKPECRRGVEYDSEILVVSDADKVCIMLPELSPNEIWPPS
jgi:hypothetical protein